MSFLRIGLLTLLLGSTAFGPNDLPDLQKKAREEHKHLVIYFAGTDWCVPCHQFRAEFIQSPKVDSLLTRSYVYYLADFPQRTKLPKSVEAQNEALAEKLNPEGVFPKLVIADENLKPVAVIQKGADYEKAYQELVNHRQ